jgi:LysM repeat protein
VWIATVLIILAAPAFTPTPVYAQDQPPLINEGFEGEFKADPYCKTGSCNVPGGWGVWFIPRRETDLPGINFQPQYVQTKTGNRVKDGSSAQRIYTENATFTGGIFRILSDVKVGAKVRFSAWGQSWSTNDESPISARPSTDIKLKIGIDPTGGNNGQASPLNGQVIWSEEHDAKDSFTQFSVETEAKSTTVIVYMYSTMKDPVRHNEVYWDGAVLEYTAPPPTATPNPTAQASGTVTDTGQITSTASTTSTVSAPTATSTPNIGSTSGVTYTVAQGDTLFDIAIKFNKSVEEIKRLNGLSSDLLSIGQVLIIEPPAQPLASTAAAQPTEVITATATPGTGALCVQAYFDDNGNGARDEGENLVSNILFNVTTKGTAVTNYTTDGTNEPYCIRNLTAGAYTVAATVANAYNPTTPLNDTANVPGGAAAQFSVGLRRVSDGDQVLGVTATPVPASPIIGSGTNILAIVATIGGGLIILGTIGFGVMFLLQSKSL